MRITHPGGQFRRRTSIAAAVSVVALLPLALTACGSNDADAAGEKRESRPSEALIEERSQPKREFAPDDAKLLDHANLTVESALGVNLTNSSVTLPLHQGKFQGRTVWYVLTESSDFGLAADIGINFSPKLSNMGIDCPKCVQEVTMEGVPGNKFGESIVTFAGIPDFSPMRKLEAGPTSFPPAVAEPGAVGDDTYSPFIRIKGSNVIYNAPIVAVGDGDFDVERHTDTADRVLAIDPPEAQAKPGRAAEGGTVEMLVVHGLEAGEEILYLSTEASNPVAATMERATFVPALMDAPFLGTDDALGSARERIFIFANGQTGADNPEAQGLAHLIEDGHASEDANLENEELIRSLAEGEGDAQNVLGDFPSLADPRHANAYSPLWDAQVGEWSQKAIDEGLNTRQDDENEILNLVAERPDLLRGPLGASFGSVGFVINCPTIGFVTGEPVIAQVAPVPSAQA